MTLHSSPASAPIEPSEALRRLREASDDHNAIRRAHRAGVTTAALASDLRRWDLLGEAIGGLAIAVARHCAESAFCDARPDIGLLTARLSESLDDLMDEAAWSVVDAAARLASIRRSGP